MKIKETTAEYYAIIALRGRGKFRDISDSDDG